MDGNTAEQTLVLIKPDELQNSLTGYILSTLSEFHTGLRFAAAKIVDWLGAPAGQGHDPQLLASVVPESRSTVISSPSAPPLMAATARAALTPIATGADSALPSPASPAFADTNVSNPLPASVSTNSTCDTPIS